MARKLTVAKRREIILAQITENGPSRTAELLGPVFGRVSEDDKARLGQQINSDMHMLTKQGVLARVEGYGKYDLASRNGRARAARSVEEEEGTPPRVSDLRRRKPRGSKKQHNNNSDGARAVLFRLQRFLTDELEALD